MSLAQSSPTVTVGVYEECNTSIPNSAHGHGAVSDPDPEPEMSTSEEPTSMQTAYDPAISVGVESNVVNFREEDSISQSTNETHTTDTTKSTTSSSGSTKTGRGASRSQSSASSVADECASEEEHANHSIKDINIAPKPSCQQGSRRPSQETIPPIDKAFSVFTQTLPALSSTIIGAPVRYAESTPGKKIRDKAAHALNLWLHVDDEDLSQIRHVIDMLHNASLILDDVEDGSVSRRGRPATHMVFGTPQAINAAGYQINRAMMEVFKLGGTECLEIFIEEMDRLYVGQGHDLFWTFNIKRPSIEKYIGMVDYKTGSLFNMLVRLMTAKTRSDPLNTPGLSYLVVLLGRYFQIRDDYMNLTSDEYAVQKGFCDDLDEGKFSLTLVHALENSAEAEHSILRHVLTQRHVSNGMSLAQKHLVMDIVKGAGSLQYAAAALREISREIDAEVGRIEGATGVENKPLRGLLEALRV